MAGVQNDQPDGKKVEGRQEDTAAAVPGIADAAAVAHPPGFESAARAEHASEAEAIRHLLSQPVRLPSAALEIIAISYSFYCRSLVYWTSALYNIMSKPVQSPSAALELPTILEAPKCCSS